MPQVTERNASVTKHVSPSAGYATFAGLCSSLVGIGLARFAYTPLLPAIIDAQWFSASAAAYLGAANLGGYLAGALLGGPMARRWPAATVLRAMMGLATLACFTCAWPVSFAWFFAWRFASGIAGGALMVLAAPIVLPHVPAARRGLASGAIFMGVGLGIAASGTIVPLLLRHGLALTWLGLGVASLVLTVAAWAGWPRDTAPATAAPPAATATMADASQEPASTHARRRLRALYVQYALNAAGLVPHMIFLVDFVARGLDRGLAVGAHYWVLFGIGAVIGPLVSGHVADRIGHGPALRAAYLIEALAVALPALAVGPGYGTGWLMVSSLIVGAFTPGVVPLVLGRVRELLAHRPGAQQGAWRTATTSFAILQAVGAYGMSFLFARSGGDYAALFALGAAALVLAFVIDVGVALTGSRGGGATHRCRR